MTPEAESGRNPSDMQGAAQGDTGEKRTVRCACRGAGRLSTFTIDGEVPARYVACDCPAGCTLCTSCGHLALSHTNYGGETADIAYDPDHPDFVCNEYDCPCMRYTEPDDDSSAFGRSDDRD